MLIGFRNPGPRVFEILRYGAGIIERREPEVKALDRKTWKIMTMCGALYPKSDVDRLRFTKRRTESSY